jgi:2-polyprenyl-3-methyl-5-hydroxy-6-metoxy-1,4-benzoquinol methylase
MVDLVSFFNERPHNLKFLDFGMGWGKWCLMAKAFGCQVYGLELSESRIAYAKKHGITVLAKEHLLQHEFDYINTDQVFEHIPEPLETLKELIECLKLNGIIKISVPNGNKIEQVLESMDWNAKKGQRNSLNAVAPLEHINCFKTKAIKLMASQSGLELTEIPKVRQHYKSKIDFIKKTIKEFTKNKQESTTLYFKKIKN